jgi:transposase
MPLTAGLQNSHQNGGWVFLNFVADPTILSRTGNRQLNAALHRVAMTQARMHPPARELLVRRKSNGDGGMEALRILKRRLSDVVYRAMLTDQHPSTAAAA